APSVSLSAATASGAVTASQKLCAPSLLASHTSAAMGSVTMTLRKRVTKPRDRAVAALSLDTRTRRGSAAETVDITLAGYAAHLTLDARHDPGLRIEEPLLHLVPAAE